MSDLPEPTLVVVPPSNPSVAVFGCGGGGINMVRETVSHLNGIAKYRFIDTSYANVRDHEEVIVIMGEGSGLNRQENVEAISQRITTLKAEDLNLSDINIVVFSLSGGSGSVIGPVLIREISRRGKLVVAVVIVSSESEKHTNNTLKTLKTLESITSTNNIYLPIMVFNNKAGKDLVDRSLPYKVERLVDLLTLPTAELDKNDRLNWINVPKTMGFTGGLRLLHVDAGSTKDESSLSAELWSGFDGYIFDSIVSIRSQQARHRIAPQTRVAYEGIFTTVQLSPMLGVIGNPPKAFEKLTAEIQDILTQYGAQSSTKKAVFGVSDAEVDRDSGLVL